ncbi:MAG: hypothetical protein MUP80_15490, partial [Acidobacteriia bacterium]|nr:hypothetical protein [Terriglobia bacterium]
HRCRVSLMQTGQARSKYPNFKEAVMQRLILLVVGSIVLAGQLLAQTAQDSWDNLRQLQAGEKIEVVDMKLKSFKGTFLSLSEEVISVRVKQDDVVIERAKVLRVTDREHSKVGRNMILCLAIGAGAGAAILAALPGEGSSSAEEAIRAAVVPIGAGPGRGGGAALPRGYRTIYRAEARRSAPSP